MIKFTCTKEETALITKIVRRANRIRKRIHLLPLDLRSAEMDLSACHSNGMPLDFEKLYSFPESDLMHDVNGITNYTDRTTGKLLEDFCFVPRCAKPCISKEVKCESLIMHLLTYQYNMTNMKLDVKM